MTEQAYDAVPFNSEQREGSSQKRRQSYGAMELLKWLCDRRRRWRGRSYVSSVQYLLLVATVYCIQYRAAFGPSTYISFALWTQSLSLMTWHSPLEPSHQCNQTRRSRQRLSYARNLVRPVVRLLATSFFKFRLSCQKRGFLVSSRISSFATSRSTSTGTVYWVLGAMYTWPYPSPLIEKNWISNLL
jgi:hypothetical protein